MVQTGARGETGAMMEGMVGEKGIVPERSEWFRSITLIGPAERFVSKKAEWRFCF